MLFTSKLSKRLSLLRVLAVALGTTGTAFVLGCTEPVAPGASDARLKQLTLAAGCFTSSAAWSNSGYTPQTDTFTIQFDATPGAASIDGVIGLSSNAAAAYTDLAAIVRFNTTGTIDARNGSTYTASQSIAYAAGTAYHFRLVVSVRAHTYSAYVTPAGGTARAIGSGYAFRTEQANVLTLANLGANTSTGGTTLCNIKVGGAVVSTPTVASVSVTPATVSIAVGATATLTATPKDASGATVLGQVIAWTSANANIATVSPSGVVTAIAAGTTTITASTGGVSGTTTATVTASTASSCSPTGSGICRYVATTGSDANPGTQAAPYRTLQQAANVVNPGDVVVVSDGVYTGGSTIVNITRSGTAANWIVFQAAHRGGAVIDGQNNASGTGVEIGGAYIRVQGFEVRGTSRYGIEAYHGHDVQVAQTNVHAIGHYCTDTSGGIVGINAYVPNMLIEQNVVHDVGRWANGQNGCTTTTSYWQNHDHGVYNGEGDNLVIRSNLFYDLQRGWPIQRYDGSGATMTGLTIVNNTFVGANPNKVGQIIIATAAINMLIANNIFYQPNTAGIWLDVSGLSGTIANNLTYGASLTSGSTTGLTVTANKVNVDPKLVNPGTPDAHLLSGSPAIGAGLPLSTGFADMDGFFRSASTTPDIGAYQYH